MRGKGHHDWLSPGQPFLFCISVLQRRDEEVLREQEERRKANAVGAVTETRMRNSTVRAAFLLWFILALYTLAIKDGKYGCFLVQSGE